MLLQSIIGIALLFLIIAFSIQIYILKKHSNAILTGLLSLVAIVYGTYTNLHVKCRIKCI